MEAKRTTLTTQLRDGELEHVVVVQGEPVQAHTSRAAAMCALMLAMACAGCETMERHPRATAFVASSLILSAGIALSKGHGSRAESFPMSEPLTLPHDVTNQPVHCTGASCQ